ncbi:MAG: hypothetical protein Q4D23_11895, partial [Bacteroidales bacterium]|nr:hypothetical protein [Bacteroidales bacterium]
RPPGYEPGELPTAPLRDVRLHSVLFPDCDCKVTAFFVKRQAFRGKIAQKLQWGANIARRC